MSTEKHTHITTVKTLMTASIIYFFCSMAGGVFYREFTKLFDFTGKTTLGVIHGHLLVLGTFFFRASNRLSNDTHVKRYALWICRTFPHFPCSSTFSVTARCKKRTL